jgi:hypothetical protein
MSTPARSVYDVRVVDVPEDEKGHETGRSWLFGFFEWAIAATTFQAPRVRLEIVAVDTGDELVRWMLRAHEAEQLRQKIASDLVRFDAETFASEWGLGSD